LAACATPASAAKSRRETKNPFLIMPDFLMQ
jgi:hypothetical protein